MDTGLIVYALKLEQGKYYIGATRNPDRRFLQHIAANGDGAEWTKVHKPLSMKILKRNADIFDEDKFVKIYMTSKGINNVRGGSYSALMLGNGVLNQLYTEIKNATGRCFNCGDPSHFASDCTKAKVNVSNNSQIINKPLTVRKCGSCGKAGHNRRSCGKK